VGDIGLIGAPAKKDGKAVQGARIIGGGTVGEGAKLAATEFEKSVALVDVKDKLREILIAQFGAKPKGGAPPPPAAAAAGAAKV
jgi:ferredoxin-nitrite reductase